MKQDRAAQLITIVIIVITALLICGLVFLLGRVTDDPDCQSTYNDREAPVTAPVICR